MYRSVIPVLLSISAALSAPQDFIDNSNVTFVQPLTSIDTVQPIVDSNIPIAESRIEKLPLTIPGRPFDVTYSIPNDDVTTEFDQSETTTDLPATTSKVVTSQKAVTTVKVLRTTEKAILPIKPSFIKPKPKFVSKLSYFNKPSVFNGNASNNLVERTGKRKFKSRCRCEKIWNCPKLQITVPRCPNEYFLCCF